MNRLELDYDLLPLLPPWYAEVLDYQQICQTEEQQFAALANEITAVAQNFFFQTMDESAVTQWEQIFGILANPQAETLEFRQSRLLNRMSSRPPYTIWFLYQKLDELIGPGQWKVNMDYPNYTLYIESTAKNQSYATEVAYTINKIKPAHLEYHIIHQVTTTSTIYTGIAARQGDRYQLRPLNCGPLRRDPVRVGMVMRQADKIIVKQVTKS